MYTGRVLKSATRSKSPSLLASATFGSVRKTRSTQPVTDCAKVCVVSVTSKDVISFWKSAMQSHTDRLVQPHQFGDDFLTRTLMTATPTIPIFATTPDLLSSLAGEPNQIYLAR